MNDPGPDDDVGVLLALALVAALVAGTPAAVKHHGNRGDPAALKATADRHLSPATILRYARAEGFTGQRARVATAVALAESSGRVRAHNPVPPDDSYCLMQINMLGDLGPARRARLGLRRNTDLYDPATCMHAAYVISGGGSDWSSWSTYTRGTYLRHLSRVP
jgi:hypothetical protein